MAREHNAAAASGAGQRDRLQAQLSELRGKIADFQAQAERVKYRTTRDVADVPAGDKTEQGRRAYRLLTETYKIFNHTVPVVPQMVLPLCHDCACDICEWLVQMSYFAPVETLLFHYILVHECKNFDDNDVVVDVGANVGYFAIYAALHGCRVLAFEPIKEARDFLLAGAFMNGVSELVTVLPYAVHSHETTLYYRPRNVKNTRWGGAVLTNDNLSLCKEHTLDSDLHAECLKGLTVVQAKPLAPFIASGKEVILMKVDTEGNEAAVFTGALPLIKAARVRHILAEIKMFQNFTQAMMIRQVVDSGYRAYNFKEIYTPIVARTKKGSRAAKAVVPKWHAINLSKRVFERTRNVRRWVPHTKGGGMRLMAEDIWFQRTPLLLDSV
jgi:FkbM family methyltransferase